MRKTFTLISILAVVVAACGDNAADETTTTTEAAAETTSTESQETTSSAAETTTTAGASTGAGGDECLVGEWTLDSAAFFEAISEEMADVGGVGEFSDASGTALTTLEADGTITDIREEWGFTVATGEGTVHLTMNGEQSGTWSTDGSTLTVNLTQADAFDVNVSVEAGGQTITLPESPVDVPTQAVAAEGEYECNGDTFTVDSDGITSTFHRP